MIVSGDPKTESLGGVINLPPKAIREFAQIYKALYNVELSEIDAEDKAKRFMTVFLISSGVPVFD